MSGCNCVHFDLVFRVHDLIQLSMLKLTAPGLRYMLGHEPLYGFFTFFIQIQRVGPRGQPRNYKDPNSSLKGRGKAWPQPMPGGQIPDVRSVIVHGVQEECTICFENSGLYKWLGFACYCKSSSFSIFLSTCIWHVVWWEVTRTLK